MVASDWYSDTITRRQLGIDFTQQIVDASLILITVSKVTNQRNLLSFLTPFDYSLWGCIVLMTLVNALLQWIVEPAGPGERPKTLFQSIYVSAATFTGVEVSREHVQL